MSKDFYLIFPHFKVRGRKATSAARDVEEKKKLLSDFIHITYKLMGIFSLTYCSTANKL